MRTVPAPDGQVIPPQPSECHCLWQALTCSGCQTARVGGAGSATAVHKHQGARNRGIFCPEAIPDQARGSRLKIPQLPLGCPSIDA
ncbi:hypothetical protein GCM10011428_02630 [Streptomyces violaceus]